jgi:hypothetical protein
MTAAFEARWRQFENALAQLYPKIGENDGLSVAIVDSAEHRLGGTLPPALRRLYVRCGVRKDLLRTYEEVLPPDRLQVDDGVLILVRENEGACQWGVPWPPAGADPPVVRMDFTAKPAWEPDHDRISDFLVWLLHWQAVNGGAPTGANGDADGRILDRLRGWHELDRTGCHWTDTRFLLRAGQAVCLIGSDPIYVCAAARDASAFAALDSALGIDWNYTWPEP